VGAVAMAGFADITPGIAPPDGSTAPPCAPASFHVYTSGGTGAATVLDIGGSAFPPSAITLDMTVTTTCQSFASGGGPGSTVSGSLSGVGATGSTLSCTVPSGTYTYTITVVAIDMAASCSVNGVQVAGTLSFRGTFVPEFTIFWLSRLQISVRAADHAAVAGTLGFVSAIG
jgi:hypothetical protein